MNKFIRSLNCAFNSIYTKALLCVMFPIFPKIALIISIIKLIVYILDYNINK